MSHIGCKDIRGGTKLLIDQVPWVVIDNIFVKPGKGQAFNRIKMRQVMTGRIVERTYKSGESIQLADVIERDLSFLYADGEDLVFMDPQSFDQIHVANQVVAGSRKWLREQDMCVITFWDEQAIAVLPPIFVELKVVEAEPNVKGDTVSGANKNAVVETGASIRVPMFVEAGDTIKIDTRSEEYISRIKD